MANHKVQDTPGDTLYSNQKAQHLGWAFWLLIELAGL